MRLVIGKKAVLADVYRCLAAAKLSGAAGLQAEDIVVEEESSEIRLENAAAAAGGGREAPIVGCYPICRALVYGAAAAAAAKKPTTGGDSAAGSTAEAKIDDWMLRALQLQTVWSSVHRSAVEAALDSLDRAVSSSDGGGGFLASGAGAAADSTGAATSKAAPSLADVFIFYGLIGSRLATHKDLISGRKNLFKFVTTFSSHPLAVSAADTATALGFRRLPSSETAAGSTAAGVGEGKKEATSPLLDPSFRNLDRFYLTTAINYTNGSPHIGHAYEMVVADVLTRYHRIFGRDVFFLTGTDEHGQKIATTAEKAGMTPFDLCTKYADEFRALNKMLGVSHAKFGRTTDPQHYRASQKIWRLSRETKDEEGRPDIYLDKYIGWYNVREETFVTEREAAATEYKDPVSGAPYEKMEEVSYFFRMGRYQKRLLEHMAKYPEFIQPGFRRTEILQRLKEPLLDLSISRTTFKWGVPVPDDDKHVMYVWFDALVNYVTGLGFGSEKDGEESTELMQRFWPVHCHLIGKDITWFHTVIWPCILMSAGMDVPRSVLSHGFVVAGDGKKMSKSLGNVVDPVETLKSGVAPDSFRFYIMKGAELGADMKFSLASLRDSHNSDLADTFGNLLHRSTGLCTKFCEGKVPDVSFPEGVSPPFELETLVTEVDRLFRVYCTQAALETILEAARNTNKFVTDKAPWAVKDNPVYRQQLCRAILESLYILAHFIEPFTPAAAVKIFERLGTPQTHLRLLSPWFDNLKAGATVTVGDVLFEKIEKPL